MMSGRRQAVLPPRLAPGDTVGIWSPSSPVAAACPRRFERGLTALRRKGFRVRVGEHAQARSGHTAGSISERLSDFHDLVRDPLVRAIITTVGGYNTNSLLEWVDFDLIRRNPKIFCGFSDVTVLWAAIWKHCGIPVAMGPALLPQFGEPGGPDSFTWSGFERVLMKGSAGVLSPSFHVYESYPRWDEADETPRVPTKVPGPVVLRPGIVEGPLIPANMGALLLLAGSPFWPDLSGAILCLEEDEEETPASVDRLLTALRHTGAFRAAAGVIFGRFRGEVGFSQEDPFEALAMRVLQDYPCPVVSDFDFGHTDPMLTLPWGVRARLDARSNAATLTILEAAVS